MDSLATRNRQPALSDGGEECRELRLSECVDPDTDDCRRATEQGLWIIAVCDPDESTLQNNWTVSVHGRVLRLYPASRHRFDNIQQQTTYFWGLT